MQFLFNQVTIIGLGLMGSSLARALKEQKLARRIVGCSQSKETLDKARELGIIDCGITNPADSVKRSELVILCTPLSTYSDIAGLIAPYLKPTAILTDIGSVKKSAIEAITTHLRRGQIFIPTHPIAGSEKSGVEAGDVTLFQGKKLIITPASKHHSPIAADKITTLWQALGSTIEIMDAEKHDRIYGSISHTIQLLSYAYASTIADITSFEEATKNVEFKGFMRLAGSNHIMWNDIFSANHEAISQAIHHFETEFLALLELIQKADYLTWRKEMDKTSKKRALHKDDIPAEELNRSYAAINPLFSYSVVIPKLIACAAYNAFPYSDYAGSGFWSFTHTLLDISPLAVKRLEIHQEQILQLAQQFLENMRPMRESLQQAHSPAFTLYLDRSQAVYQKL